MGFSDLSEGWPCPNTDSRSCLGESIRLFFKHDAFELVLLFSLC